jgi:hypothetical protein
MLLRLQTKGNDAGKKGNGCGVAKNGKNSAVTLHR